MKLFEFLHSYGNTSTIIDVLRRERLLATSVECSNCRNQMKERKKNSTDGIAFVCNRSTCRSEKTIRTCSFFEGSKLSLCDCMLIIHLWCKNYTESLICDEFDFSNKTIIDWFRYCRDLCVFDFEHDMQMIGGPGTIVEIDETLAVKRKNHQGRAVRDGWLFGGIERRADGQFKCFLKLVYNRSAPLLTHLIREHVAVGTTIITDGWAAYSNLADFGYQHRVVIHEENFVSPENAEVHTQRIESTWSSLKRFIRSRGGNKGPHYLEYICEYVFRRKNSDVFEALMETIRDKYKFN